MATYSSAKSFSGSKSELEGGLKLSKRKTFKEEYLKFLKKFEIEYNKKYLFDWIEYL